MLTEIGMKLRESPLRSTSLNFLNNYLMEISAKDNTEIYLELN
jgi:hypothetical protein